VKSACSARGLDDLMVEIGEDGRDSICLNVDVQGAELMVLKGRRKNPPGQSDLINIEVNFDELYIGCPQIDDIDDFFLRKRGLARVEIACPFHRLG